MLPFTVYGMLAATEEGRGKMDDEIYANPVTDCYSGVRVTHEDSFGTWYVDLTGTSINTVVSTKKINAQVLFDYDASGNVTGIEIMEWK